MNPGGPVSEEESFRCERHSLTNTTSGFCPSCLSERLTYSHRSSSTCRPNDYHKQQQEDNNFNRDEIRVSEDDDDLEKDILEMEAQIDAIVNNFKSINIQQHNNQKPNHFWSNWRGRKTTVASSHKSTQSEVADYGFGRRSCDITGPRFSLDMHQTRSLEEEEEGSIPTQSKGLIERSSSMRDQNATKVSPASMDIYSIGAQNELQTDDSTVNKKKTTPQRWWRNLKVKVWGSSNSTRIRKLTRSSSWINNKHHFHSDNNNNPPPPNHVNNGFLRFYLTPLRASRRSGTGPFMSSKAC